MNNFEQKLAAFKPRVLKNVTRQTPFRYAAPEYRPNDWLRYATVGRYLAVGLCCFILGAGLMYGLQNIPVPENKPDPPPPPGYAVMELNEAKIAKLRRPIDVMRIAEVGIPVQKMETKKREEPSLFRLTRTMPEYQPR